MREKKNFFFVIFPRLLAASPFVFVVCVLVNHKLEDLRGLISSPRSIFDHLYEQVPYDAFR